MGQFDYMHKCVSNLNRYVTFNVNYYANVRSSCCRQNEQLITYTPLFYVLPNNSGVVGSYKRILLQSWVIAH